MNDKSGYCNQCRSEIDASHGPLACDARDGARYRWLRDHAGMGFQITMEMRREADEWDAEIDAAMAGGGK